MNRTIFWFGGFAILIVDAKTKKLLLYHYPLLTNIQFFLLKLVL